MVLPCVVSALSGRGLLSSGRSLLSTKAVLECNSALEKSMCGREKAFEHPEKLPREPTWHKYIAGG